MSGNLSVHLKGDGAKSTGQKWPKRVLIAEDEALIRLDLVELLTEEGFEVMGRAVDGEEAVKLVRELEPNLIIMDVKIPGIGGTIAAEIIGEERITPIPTLTTFNQSELAERTHDADMMGYPVKPFGASEVVPAIEAVIGHFAKLWIIGEELTNLEDRFESRKVIDQAGGMLQEELGLAESEALRWIQRTAMDLRKPMCEVTEGVISHKRKK